MQPNMFPAGLVAALVSAAAMTAIVALRYLAASGGFAWATARMRPGLYTGMAPQIRSEIGWSLLSCTIFGLPAGVVAWAVLAVIGLHSLLEYPLWYGPFQIAAVLGVGLLGVPGIVARPLMQDFAYRPPAVAYWRVGVVTALMAACTYAAWDYWRVSQLYMQTEQRSAAYRDDTTNKVRSTRLFQNQVQFAELTTTPVTASNAAHIREMALKLIHFSPEPRVVEKLVESAVQLGRDDEALYFLARYRAAFSDAHAKWAAQLNRNKAP